MGAENPFVLKTGPKGLHKNNLADNRLYFSTAPTDGQRPIYAWNKSRGIDTM
jgi:hypothetical protein